MRRTFIFIMLFITSLAFSQSRIEFVDNGTVSLTILLEGNSVVGGYGQGDQYHVIQGGYFDGTYLYMVDRSHGPMGNENARVQMRIVEIENGRVINDYLTLRDGTFIEGQWKGREVRIR